LERLNGEIATLRKAPESPRGRDMVEREVVRRVILKLLESRQQDQRRQAMDTLGLLVGLTEGERGQDRGGSEPLQEQLYRYLKGGE
jgi:hypothetical protein